MKKIPFVFLLAIVFACGSGADKNSKKPLYEVLTQQNTGGAQVHFFEILTEAKEIKMLENDENLKKKIKPGDINTSNFVILNLGEKNSGGYGITVDKVEETADKIIVTVKETSPAEGEMTTSVMTNPYTIVKINSK
ncbi:MAG TPA: protease complex subunit PrcB family protein, partial [Flavobacterium sp.]|nr:protease complex subunit PrcB family protein [Flavobacterium sp.]